jgi:hypothetical protein
VRQVLHLVRAGATPAVLADRDWVVYLDPHPVPHPQRPELARHGAPPLPPGPIDHEQLVALAFAADLVITW